ncbi:hypothetical protein GUJ16_13795 [Enterococcus hirae]|nr:hypothetical protein [Enterococcus hirae]
MRQWAGMVATWLSEPGSSVYAVPALHLIVNLSQRSREAVDARVGQLRDLLPGHALEILLAHDSRAEHTPELASHLPMLSKLLHDPTSDLTSVVASTRRGMRAGEVAVEVVNPTATALAAARHAEKHAKRVLRGDNPYPSPFARPKQPDLSPDELSLPTLTITDHYGRKGRSTILKIGTGEGASVVYLATALIHAGAGWVLKATITKGPSDNERSIRRRRQVVATAFQRELAAIRTYLTEHGYPQLPTVEDLLDRVHLTSRHGTPVGVSTFTFVLPEPSTTPTTARQALTALSTGA